MSTNEFSECQQDFNGILDDEETNDVLCAISNVNSDKVIFNHTPRSTTQYGKWHAIVRDLYTVNGEKFKKDTGNHLNTIIWKLQKREGFTTDRDVAEYLEIEIAEKCQECGLPYTIRRIGLQNN